MMATTKFGTAVMMATTKFGTAVMMATTKFGTAVMMAGIVVFGLAPLTSHAPPALPLAVLGTPLPSGLVSPDPLPPPEPIAEPEPTFTSERDHMEWIVRQAASKIPNLDPELMVHVCQQESSMRWYARGPDDDGQGHAYGLCQVKVQTARYIKRRLLQDQDWQHVQRWDLMNPHTSARLGTAYMGYLLKRFNGNVRVALAAYNMGPEYGDQHLLNAAWRDGGYAQSIWVRYSMSRYQEQLRNTPKRL